MPLLKFGSDPPVAMSDEEIKEVRVLERMNAQPVDRIAKVGDPVVGPCGLRGRLARDEHDHWFIVAEVLHRQVAVRVTGPEAVHLERAA